MDPTAATSNRSAINNILLDPHLFAMASVTRGVHQVNNGGHSTCSGALCLVCGDKASGKHYGVPSCDGCRGFFKRSIRKNINYVCKEGGNCVVDVARRNQCQACRFRKCLQANMRKDSVQHERAPRTAVLHNGNGESLRRRQHTTLGHLTSLTMTSCDRSQLAGTSEHLATAAALLLATPLPTIPCYLPPAPAPPLSLPLSLRSSWPSAAFSAVTSRQQPVAEQEVTSSGVPETGERASAESPPPQSTTLPQFMDSASESAARLLFIAVKWARSMPSFLQFAIHDQQRLLEAAWSQLFVITAAQWSFPSCTDTLSGGTENREYSPQLQEDVRTLRHFVARCASLNVDHTEYACLKALALFRPDSRGVRDTARADSLQEQTQVLLGEHCARLRCEASARRRLGRLLLLLPASRRPPSDTLQELFFRHTVGEVPIECLLGDMHRTSL